MKYMLLIRAPWSTARPSTGCSFEDWIRYDKEIKDAGVLVSGHPLADLATARRCRSARTASAPSPTGRSPRPGRCSAGSTSSTCRTSTSRWTGPPAARAPAAAARSGPSDRRFDGGLIVPGERAAVGSSVEAVFREERGRLLAALVRRFGDLDLAEEVASEADRGGAGALAGRRRPGRPGRLADDHGPARGGRPAAARPGVRRPARRTPGRGRAGRLARRPPTRTATCPTSGCSSSSPARTRPWPPRTAAR